MEEKKAATQALIESIGKKKAFADEAVEASRADEGAAAALQVLVAMLIGNSDSTQHYFIANCHKCSTLMSSQDCL